MNRTEFDVIIVGAGAAGVSCAHHLLQKGFKVLVLEAQARAGGRIRTVRESGLQTPIELGAEFIHGRPHSTLKYMEAFGLPFYDVCDNHLFFQNGKLQKLPRFWEQLNQVMSYLNPQRKKDRSIKDFMDSLRKIDAKTMASFQAFVEGFHSADIHLIGERGLALTEQTDEEEINQSSIFRVPGGYDQLIQGIVHSFPPDQNVLKFNQVVKKIKWRKGRACVVSHSSSGIPLQPLYCKNVVITVPLGVLKAPTTSQAAIELDPLPGEYVTALTGMRMGDVQRMTFHFRHRFWDELSKEPVGFLHAGPEKYFPTWWTLMPLRTPLLVAWQGGPKALELAHLSEEERVKAALVTLSEITGQSLSFLSDELQSWSTHNWTKDPFSLGAYSYVVVDGAEKSKRLSRPFDDTLYFAGEATVAGATRGTVNGALDSGIRVAQQIIKKHAMHEVVITL